MIVVVKVGSSSVTADTVQRLCSEIAVARQAGHTVVVVTSGAIAAGWSALGRGEQRPSDPAVLQAVSAVGQHRLMRLWQDGLDPHGALAGQVLLAPLDFVHRTQYLHRAGRCATWSSSAWCRWSTRTTPWRTRRFASGTTTGWRR